MAELIPPTMRGGAAECGERQVNGPDAGSASPAPVTPIPAFGGQPKRIDSARSPAAATRAAPRGDDNRPAHAANHRQAFAAIDLGTNNCRLLIARPQGENFVVIDAFSRVVRLGEGLAQTGHLSQEAMDRTMAALHVCADKLRRRNVHLARSVATEACRRAENGQAFIERVRQETGIALDIISAQEEARLAVMGCHILLEQGEGPALVFDIGGGSTELVLIENLPGQAFRILDWQSVPWGVVSLTESCAAEESGTDARAARYAWMCETVSEAFRAFAERIVASGKAGLPPHRLRLLGTSGTVTTLASLHLRLSQYDRRAVDGLVMPTGDMREICRRLATMSMHERQEQPCIGRERSDLVVAGCAILESILDLWPADRLGVADRGIREGILRSLMASEGAAARGISALRAARRGGRA